MFTYTPVRTIGIMAICCLACADCLAAVSSYQQDESAVSTPAGTEVTFGTMIDPKFSEPPWFEDQTVSNENGIFLYIQTDDPCSNPLEAENALDKDCCAAIAEIIDQWYLPGAGAKIGIDRGYINEHLVFDDRLEVKQYRDQHTEELCKSFGKDYEYFRGYAQLLLTDKFRDDIKKRWQTHQTRSRLMQSGAIGASFFGLLLILFGYLRLEQVTRGFYSGRLQMLTIVVVLILVASVFWLAQVLHMF